jgi:hypothetical protein
VNTPATIPSSIPNATIIEAMAHDAVWRGWFKDPKTWAPWRSFLKTLFALPLDATELKLYRECTRRTTPPKQGFTEAWLVVGRRGGKSMVLALIACYLRVFRDWTRFLSPSEIGTIRIIATDRKQSRVIHRYCRALLTQVPSFSSLIKRADDDAIELTNRVTIEVQTASFRSVRGYTVIACLCDEIAYWRNDETAANPDSEIIGAVRPSMATIPGAMLLCASSPYARRGELWQAHRNYHGRDDAGVLVWQAPTRTMNSTVPESFIRDELDKDPAKAGAEYLAQFRSDIESFISREVVDAAVVPDRHELLRRQGVSYVAFVDPAGGSGQDSMTVAIAHREKDGRVVLDAVREARPPFSPEATAVGYAAFIRGYHCARVTGDHYAGEWPREQFQKGRVQYVTSDRPKSALYQDALPLLNSGSIELLDHPRLISQLCALERRTSRGGRDSIDHPPGSHDDVVNACMGAICLAADAKHQGIRISPDIMRRARLPNALRGRTTVGTFPR